MINENSPHSNRKAILFTGKFLDPLNNCLVFHLPFLQEMLPPEEFFDWTAEAMMNKVLSEVPPMKVRFVGK